MIKISSNFKMSVINILMYLATWKPRGVDQNEKGKLKILTTHIGKFYSLFTPLLFRSLEVTAQRNAGMARIDR